MLVGLETSDDAGVYRLNDQMAIVQSVDFFTPIVDDPYVFGQIAAANALSDIYAMGAQPLTALNLIAFPVDKLDLSIMAAILSGGASKIEESGAVLVGGHSIDEDTPKYGLSVTGLVTPGRQWSNAGARAGQDILLTKPVGIGIMTTAIKNQQIGDDDIEAAVKVMSTLNAAAAEALRKVGGVAACTDVTGFGLLGHASEMAAGSGVGMRIQAGRVPVIDAAWNLAERGQVPGGSRENLRYLSSAGLVAFDDAVSDLQRTVLADAVTSGGLLVAVDKDRTEALTAELKRAGTPAWSVIGETVSDHPGVIRVQA